MLYKVSDDSVLRQVTDDIVVSADVRGKVYVDCSTVHPNTTVAVAKQIYEAGAEFIAGSWTYVFHFH